MQSFLKIFLALSLLLSGSSIMAQSDDGHSPATKFGIKLGGNLSNVKQDLKQADNFDTKSQAGIHLGFFLDHQLSNEFHFQSGLLFSSKGFGDDEDMDEGDFDKYIFNYIEVPLHAAYSITEDFQIYAGPYIAFGVGGKNKMEYDGDADTYELVPYYGAVDPSELGDDEEAYRAFDYGLNFGLGYQIDKFLINLGYSIGMGNLTPSYKDSPFDADDFKLSNRVLSISFGYFL